MAWHIPIVGPLFSRFTGSEVRTRSGSKPRTRAASASPRIPTSLNRGRANGPSPDKSTASTSGNGVPTSQGRTSRARSPRLSPRLSRAAKRRTASSGPPAKRPRRVQGTTSALRVQEAAPASKRRSDGARKPDVEEPRTDAAAADGVVDESKSHASDLEDENQEYEGTTHAAAEPLCAFDVLVAMGRSPRTARATSELGRPREVHVEKLNTPVATAAVPVNMAATLSPVTSSLQPPDEDGSDEDDEEYLISAIENSRWNRQSRYREYLVRWVGYDDPTWEPEEVLEDTIALDTYQRDRREVAPTKQKKTASDKTQAQTTLSKRPLSIEVHRSKRRRSNVSSALSSVPSSFLTSPSNPPSTPERFRSRRRSAESRSHPSPRKKRKITSQDVPQDFKPVFPGVIKALPPKSPPPRPKGVKRLTFGVTWRFLLPYVGQKLSDFDSHVLHNLADELNSLKSSNIHCLPPHHRNPTRRGCPVPQRWTITADPRVRPSGEMYHDPALAGMKFQSVVLSSRTLFLPAGLNDLTTVMRHLKSSPNVPELYFPPTSSTHIHIGDHKDGFTLPVLKHIAALVWTFEPTIEELYQPSRRGRSDPSVRSFRVALTREAGIGAAKYPPDHPDGLDMIYSCKTIEELVGTMNGDTKTWAVYLGNFLPFSPHSPVSPRFPGKVSPARVRSPKGGTGAVVKGGKEPPKTVVFKALEGTMRRVDVLNWVMVCLWIVDWGMKAAERSEDDVKAELHAIETFDATRSERSDRPDDSIEVFLEFLGMKGEKYEAYRDWAIARSRGMNEEGSDQA